jgi:hypothetical protein
MDEADVSTAKTTAAEFIRDGLFRLGPTFVKLGQASQTKAPARPPAHPPRHAAARPPCTLPAPALCRPPTHRLPPVCQAVCHAPQSACGARASYLRCRWCRRARTY